MVNAFKLNFINTSYIRYVSIILISLRYFETFIQQLAMNFFVKVTIHSEK